jgi:hypothetical protein
MSRLLSLSGARGHLDAGLKCLVQTGLDLKSPFNSNGFRSRRKPDWPVYWQPCAGVASAVHVSRQAREIGQQMLLRWLLATYSGCRMAVSMPLAVGGLALVPEGSRSSSPGKTLRNAFLDGPGSDIVAIIVSPCPVSRL